MFHSLTNITIDIMSRAYIYYTKTIRKKGWSRKRNLYPLEFRCKYFVLFYWHIWFSSRTSHLYSSLSISWITMFFFFLLFEKCFWYCLLAFDYYACRLQMPELLKRNKKNCEIWFVWLTKKTLFNSYIKELKTQTEINEP